MSLTMEGLGEAGVSGTQSHSQVWWRVTGGDSWSGRRACARRPASPAECSWMRRGSPGERCALLPFLFPGYLLWIGKMKKSSPNAGTLEITPRANPLWSCPIRPLHREWKWASHMALSATYCRRDGDGVDPGSPVVLVSLWSLLLSASCVWGDGDVPFLWPQSEQPLLQDTCRSVALTPSSLFTGAGNLKDGGHSLVWVPGSLVLTLTQIDQKGSNSSDSRVACLTITWYLFLMEKTPNHRVLLGRWNYQKYPIGQFNDIYYFNMSCFCKCMTCTTSMLCSIFFISSLHWFPLILS